MAILTRFARLLKADLHALLDRMEAPDVLLQQAVREMEADLLARQQQLKQGQIQLQQLQQQINKMQQQMQEQQVELALCLDADNDSLARTLLRRQLETTQRLQQVQEHEQHLQLRLQTDAADIENQNSTFDALRAQAEWLIQREDINHSATLDPVARVSDADIELALLKAKRERSES